MQKEIGERAWSVQVFTLPEHWTCPLRDSDENKLWTGEKTQLKQKKELNLLLLPPALSDQHQEANFFRSIQVQFETNSHAAPVL